MDGYLERVLNVVNLTNGKIADERLSAEYPSMFMHDRASGGGTSPMSSGSQPSWSPRIPEAISHRLWMGKVEGRGAHDGAG